MGEQIDTRDASNLRKYSILGALTLYLDFINLFLMLLRIFWQPPLILFSPSISRPCVGIFFLTKNDT